MTRMQFTFCLEYMYKKINKRVKLKIKSFHVLQTNCVFFNVWKHGLST